ncbi:MAG TPA: response regulator [Allosphingosinicella sp.]|jgi:CheY-like chemotaxis protein
MHQASHSILLVEDEPLVLRTTADLLSEGGYRVLEASSYGEALSRIEACPDLAAIVTDIGISGEQDGIALARTVAERWPHLRIVLVSGRTRPSGTDYPQDAIFFTKPYAPGALLTLLRQSLDGELEPRAPAMALDGDCAF